MAEEENYFSSCNFECNGSEQKGVECCHWEDRWEFICVRLNHTLKSFFHSERHVESKAFFNPALIYMTYNSVMLPVIGHPLNFFLWDASKEMQDRNNFKYEIKKLIKHLQVIKSWKGRNKKWMGKLEPIWIFSKIRTVIIQAARE